MYISINNVTKIFSNNQNEERKVIDNVTFGIERGEFICILGFSGCGKTTLLNLIAGFETPDEGDVFIGDREVTEPSSSCIMTFQNYGLLPWRTVQKNVELGLEVKKLPKSKIQEIANEYIELVGLTDFRKFHPGQLSSGMQQRVALARALCVDPDVILMDEPFGALDTITRMKLQDDILKIWEKKKQTIVFVTHDISESVYLADRIVIMAQKTGKIKKIIKIDLERKRSRTSREFNKYANEAFYELGL